MGRKNYLPSNTLVFKNMVHNIYMQVNTDHVRWDISQAAISKLDAPLDNFNAAADKSENPETRTASAIRHRNETRATFEKVLRPFIQGHLIHNSLVTEHDLIKMGLPVHDHTPTPSPVPDQSPYIQIYMPSPAVLEIKFGGKDERRHGKPFGMHGIEVHWILSETPPNKWSELTQIEFITRSPLRLSFEADKRGMQFYIAARWQNTRGVKGPWTEIINAIVP
jgi:hypothetical protein